MLNLNNNLLNKLNKFINIINLSIDFYNMEYYNEINKDEGCEESGL